MTSSFIYRYRKYFFKDTYSFLSNQINVSYRKSASWVPPKWVKSNRRKKRERRKKFGQLSIRKPQNVAHRRNNSHIFSQLKFRPLFLAKFKKGKPISNNTPPGTGVGPGGHYRMIYFGPGRLACATQGGV